MNLRAIFYFLFFLVLFACTPAGKDRGSEHSLTGTPPKPRLIIIQPFSDLPAPHAKSVYDEVKKHYPHVILKTAIDIPPAAYYKKRNRYRADSLIRILKSVTSEGCTTIGLTCYDISNTNGKIEDYGIMGLGYQPGSSCVASTFRLSKKNVTEQFVKVAVHELGHTQGLPHCVEKTCFMRDAEGKNHHDEETGFCKRCQAVLVSKGWKF